MAGIGGYPQVIELPKDTRWDALGQGLGKFAGSIFDAWNTADATQKAQQIVGPDGLPDLDKQMVYLQSRLGEKGGKLIQDRMKMQEMRTSMEASRASIRRSDAEVASAQIADKLKTLQLQEEPKKFQMEQALQAAEAQAARARAAGVSSEIAERMARVGQIKSEMARKDKEDELTDTLTKAAMETLAKRRAQPAPATVQPQSYEYQPGQGGGEGGEGPGTIQAPVRQIATGDVVVPTGAGGGGTGTPQGPVDESGKPAETSTFSPHRVLQVARDAAAGKPITTEAPPVPDSVLMEAVGHLAKRDIAGYYKVLNDAGIGKEIKEMPVPGAPGYFIASAVYPDGRMHPVPGAAPIAKLAKTPEGEVKAGNGVLSVYQSLQTLKDLGTTGDNGKDPLGGKFSRMFAQKLYDWGWATGDPNKTDYITTTLQSRLGIDTLASGLRETNQFRGLLDQMTPKIGDSEDVRQSKLQALEAMSDISVKARVENAMANGEAVPPALEQIYLSRGLINADLATLGKTVRASTASATQAAKRPQAGPKAEDLGGGFSLTPMGP